MLETIRGYAAERLEESGEAQQLRRRHAQHFLALAEEAEPHLRDDSAEWLDRLGREHDNMRAALDRLEASGESQLALRLAGALSRFWEERGPLTEGQRRLEDALRADERPTAARARALNGASSMAVVGGDAAIGRLRAEEALALHRTFGDAWSIANSLWQLGYALAEEGDWARAQQLLHESVRLFRDVGDQNTILWATRTLAWTYEELGDRERARALHEENLGRARVLGNEQLEATLLGALSMIAVDEGRVEEALSMRALASSVLSAIP
jgi:non-specific serine/threonine protein kinase